MKGAMRAAESRSVEPVKIRAIHAGAGSQYFGPSHRSRIAASDGSFCRRTSRKIAEMELPFRRERLDNMT